MSATITAVSSASSTADLTVAELLTGIDRGDESAWAEIVRRYGQFVLAKARSFRMQEADVLDAVQITWLKLAENSRTLHSPERLGGWLATTISRECLRILRQSRRILYAVDTVQDQADPAVGPDQRAVDAETARIVRSVVAELPAPRRDLLVALFDDDPSPYAELSASMGIPVGSIGPTRARILRQLRSRLHERELAPGA